MGQREGQKMEPVRKCVACNKRFPKRELLRVVKNQSGTITLDETQKADGRGAYVCRTPECMKLAVEKRQLNRAYRQNVPPEVYQQVESAWKKA